MTNSLHDLAVMFGQLAAGGYKRSLSPLLDSIGHEMQAEIQREIGTYQGAIGPFGSTAPLSPNTIEMKAKFGYGKGGSPDTPLWRTGDFHDSIKYQKDLTNLRVVIGSNEKHVKYHEIGTSNEPPRPVLGPSVMRVIPRMMPQITKAAGIGIAGGVWSGLGAQAKTQVGGTTTGVFTT